MDRALREEQWADGMRRALAGDETAYRELLRSLAPWLRQFARARLARAGAADIEAEDAVQETLLAIHLKRHTWRSHEPIGPWIHAIARNKLVDLLRRRGRRAELPLDDAPEGALVAADDAPGADGDIARVLDSLDARQRRIVQLVSLEGHSAAAAAGVLGMTEGALRVALHRALKGLALRFGAERT